MKDWIMELCPEIAEWQADLIAEQAQREVAAEREACAKVCVKLYDKFSDDPDMVRLKARHAFVLDGCAAAIRARGQA